MGKIHVDFSELEDFCKKLERFEQSERDKFIDDCCKELAARFLQKVIPRTPVGQYPPESGRMGGTLRRGWTGGKDVSGTAYARSLPIRHVGNSYEVEITNPTEYASYVEFGHRQHPGQYVPTIGKRLVKSWVDGRKFMTISEDELKGITPALLNKLLEERMRELFND